MILFTLVFAFAAGAATPAMALSAKKKAVIKVIRKAAKSKHLNKAEIKALLKICKRESGYRPGARTGSCKGLFQLKTHFGRKKWANAKWNTLKAIKYIKHRYGSCRAALRHSNSYGWY
jgi:SLT domain-containing protein